METDPELIKIRNFAGTCIKRDAQPWMHCVYSKGQPRDDQCNGSLAGRPCKRDSVIFVTKLDYATWKLTN